jgi:hypothetical protein
VGVIYFGQECKSLGKNAKIEETSKEEKDWIQKTLKENNLKKEVKDFKKIVPISKRPFY